MVFFRDFSSWIFPSLIDDIHIIGPAFVIFHIFQYFVFQFTYVRLVV